MYSTYAHAEDVHVATRTLKEKDIGVILRLRYPQDLTSVASFSISMALQAYRALIWLYLDDEAIEKYASWYKNEISVDFMYVTKSKIVDQQFRSWGP
jgi:hypothetical protein